VNSTQTNASRKQKVTAKATKTTPFATTTWSNAITKLPTPVQHIIKTVFFRVRDPVPELDYANRQKAAGSQALKWGWLPLLTLTTALGVLSVAHTYTSARSVAPGAELFFWFGLLLIFVPAVVRFISPAASRFERIALLCVVCTGFYLVKVTGSPLYFTSYDEFLHWVSANDIARSGHLFTENAMLPVSPFYPGLEIVTNAFSRLSGLSTFNAGIIVVGVAHLVMILSLFMLCEQITKSARMAGIAAIIYMTNPHFLFFDAQFAYESLALPLATFMLYVIARYESLKVNRLWIPLAAWITLVAVVVTHHVTDIVFDGLLILWTAMYAVQRTVRWQQWNLAATALLGILLTSLWIDRSGNPFISYIASFLIGALDELGNVLTGASQARHLFVDYSGQGLPPWERLMSLSSVALIAASLPFGLLCLWQRCRNNALAWVLGVVALLYPVSQLFRLTNFGSELSDRAAAFLFIAIACLLAIFIAQFWPTWQTRRWKSTVLITCALAVMFLGGTILGAGPSWSILPGPYLVAADSRSIEPEGIQAATWAQHYLGPDNRVATDRTNRLLMSTYGDQRVVTPSADNIDTAPVFFSTSLGTHEIALLQDVRVRYLVVDQRLSTALPRIGFYFDPGETGAYEYTRPLDLEALTKFNRVPQINRVFDSGDIVIYDVGGLINAPENP
jgi:hypothetical protein